MAEAAHSALVCKNWRRLIPLELRSLFILAGLICRNIEPLRVGWQGQNRRGKFSGFTGGH